MLIKKIGQISKKDSSSAGGKGASLGEMMQSDIFVPDGFIILADVFEEFIKKAGIKEKINSLLKNINSDDLDTINLVSHKIKSLILKEVFPSDLGRELENSFKDLNAQYVAVRSSATAEDGAENAWAGQLDTYLYTTRSSLFENIKKCWASLFSPRAILYRFEKGQIDDFISVAVVVQKMIDSEVSGVCFTVHPVTQEKTQMIIEAGFGLGEAIVGGKITPDSYIVDKNDFSIVKINVSEQEIMIVRGENGTEERKVTILQKEVQKIDNEKIIELSKICQKIENHYGFPCDIEWAFADGRFYILQSRPITSL